MPGIFISHTQGDKAIAAALSSLIESLFGKKVRVAYSSDKHHLGGGPRPGADWFNWIVEEVRSADVALILLTPSSVQKPWVLWEAGAVAGAAYATAKTAADERRVCPIVFGLSMDDVPSPFARTQLIRGTDSSELKQLTQDLFRRFAAHMDDDEKSSFGENRKDAETRYLQGLEPLLQKLPHTVTEAAIQEWIQRLDQLEREQRFSEVAVLEEWLDVSFGREDDARARPIDVRIHRRLGELYARAGEAQRAARQFELARKLAPRDIFVLRRLGKAHLDCNDLEKCKAVLDAIEDLDARAFSRNVESAALKTRWHESRGDRVGALSVLRSAYQELPGSYYLGDRLGQLLLLQGEVAAATSVYSQVITTLEQLSEQNVWTHATALTAAIATQNSGRAEAALAALLAHRPSREERNSIVRGLNTVLSTVTADSPLRGVAQRIAAE